MAEMGRCKLASLSTLARLDLSTMAHLPIVSYPAIKKLQKIIKPAQLKLQNLQTIYCTSIYTSKSNTLIQRLQYQTDLFKLHNIHYMHIQHNNHRQDHKCKVNTWKHRYLVIPRIAASRASSSVIVPRIVADRATSGAIEDVVDEVISWVV
jgi:hypothetical protein